MKKLLIVLMVLSLAIGLAACGGDAETTTSAPEVTTDAPATTTAAPATTTAAPATTTAAPATTTAAPATTTEAPAATTEATTTKAEVVADFDLAPFAVALSLKAPAAKTPASSYTVWDGTVATSFAGGNGTEDDPYLISNGAELAYLSYLVQTIPAIPNPHAGDGSLMLDKNPTSGVYYKLTQDIYLNDVTDISAWDDDVSVVPEGVNVWTPIGLAGQDLEDGIKRSFAGHFDGAGFTVFGLYVSHASRFAGLFGDITGDGTLSTLEEFQDVGLEGVPSSVSNLTIAYSMVSGYGYVGTIAGYGTRAYFKNCVVDETVNVVQLPNATAMGGVAGLVGRTIGFFEDCYNSADVRAQIYPYDKKGDGVMVYTYPSFSAGFTSCIQGYMLRCANFGDVYAYNNTGLFVAYVGGSSAGLVTNCYAEGTLYDGWAGIDTSVADRRNIASVGPFAAISTYKDSSYDYTIQRCVSAGKYADGFDPTATANASGMVAGKHHGWTAVDTLIYVDHGFAEGMYYVSDWEDKGQYLWTNIYAITPEQLVEYRAAYAE